MSTLYLIPTTLNPESNNSALLPEQKNQIKHLKHFIVETAKVCRPHIKHLELDTALQELSIMELNKHKQDYSELIAPLLRGEDVGLMSDCGCPAIADPGSRVVSIAHELGINVTPFVGPSSILLTLMASGMNGQNFSFIGYLPAEPDKRKIKLKSLENQILKDKTTFIFIEAPFRNQKLFEALVSQLNNELKLCLGINLMTDTQQIISKNINDWKKTKINLTKEEVIFLIGQ